MKLLCAGHERALREASVFGRSSAVRREAVWQIIG